MRFGHTTLLALLLAITAAPSYAEHASNDMTAQDDEEKTSSGSVVQPGQELTPEQKEEKRKKELDEALKKALGEEEFKKLTEGMSEEDAQALKDLIGSMLETGKVPPGFDKLPVEKRLELLAKAATAIRGAKGTAAGTKGAEALQSIAKANTAARAEAASNANTLEKMMPVAQATDAVAGMFGFNTGLAAKAEAKQDSLANAATTADQKINGVPRDFNVEAGIVRAQETTDYQGLTPKAATTEPFVMNTDRGLVSYPGIQGTGTKIDVPFANMPSSTGNANTAGVDIGQKDSKGEQTQSPTQTANNNPTGGADTTKPGDTAGGDKTGGGDKPTGEGDSAIGRARGGSSAYAGGTSGAGGGAGASTDSSDSGEGFSLGSFAAGLAGAKSDEDFQAVIADQVETKEPTLVQNNPSGMVSLPAAQAPKASQPVVEKKPEEAPAQKPASGLLPMISRSTASTPAAAGGATGIERKEAPGEKNPLVDQANLVAEEGVPVAKPAGIARVRNVAGDSLYKEDAPSTASTGSKGFMESAMDTAASFFSGPSDDEDEAPPVAAAATTAKKQVDSQQPTRASLSAAVGSWFNTLPSSVTTSPAKAITLLSGPTTVRANDAARGLLADMRARTQTDIKSAYGGSNDYMQKLLQQNTAEMTTARTPAAIPTVPAPVTAKAPQSDITSFLRGN